MSFLTRLLFVTLLAGSCIPQNPEDFILLTLEGIAARQDRLLQKFDEQNNMMESKIDELDRKMERKIDEVTNRLTGVQTSLNSTQEELVSKFSREEQYKLTMTAHFNEVSSRLTGVEASLNSTQEELVSKFSREEQYKLTMTAHINELANLKRSADKCLTTDNINTFQSLLAKDDCLEGRQSCSTSAICKDGIGHYMCVCMSGYSGDGLTCEDINECMEVTDICGEGGICINHPGTYGCLCQSGFIEINNFCTDVNECEDSSNVCGDEVNCINFPGNYSCSCNKGFRKQENTCQDINECETTNHLCHAYATCTNTRGGYTCECLPYYYGDGFTCKDINECETTNHLCHANATCTNTIGGYTCECLPYYYGDGFTCTEITERNGSNCKELLDSGVIESGVYTITPEGFPSGVEVYCDQETSNGGWTVILKRKKQSHQLDFNRTCQQYSSGFGDPNGEIWIGNRVLHSMTGEESFTLRVDAKNLEGESRTGIWETFSVGSEDTEFTLSVADYSSSSTLGDGLWKPSSSYHPENHMKFSTIDRDNDRWSSDSCSARYGQGGGWWYNSCGGANPTAPFGDRNRDYTTANWRYWQSSSSNSATAISEIQFMIRP